MKKYHRNKDADDVLHHHIAGIVHQRMQVILSSLDLLARGIADVQDRLDDIEQHLKG